MTFSKTYWRTGICKNFALSPFCWYCNAGLAKYMNFLPLKHFLIVLCLKTLSTKQKKID